MRESNFLGGFPSKTKMSVTVLTENSIIQETCYYHCVNLHSSLHLSVVDILPGQATSATISSLLRWTGSYLPLHTNLTGLHELEAG